MYSTTQMPKCKSTALILAANFSIRSMLLHRASFNILSKPHTYAKPFLIPQRKKIAISYIV